MPRQPIDTVARFQADIGYLVSRGIDVSRLRSSDQAHRQAQAARKAEAAGRPLPTKEQLRGHGQPPVIDVPKSGHTLYQRQIYAIPGIPLNGSNLARLIKKSPDPKQRDFLLVVQGIIDTGSPLDLDAESGQTKTYTYNIKKSSVQNWLKANRETDLTMLFHRHDVNIRWIEIQMVAIAYPGEK